jgi:hypothetical protein
LSVKVQFQTWRICRKTKQYKMKTWRLDCQGWAIQAFWGQYNSNTIIRSSNFSNTITIQYDQSNFMANTIPIQFQPLKSHFNTIRNTMYIIFKFLNTLRATCFWNFFKLCWDIYLTIISNTHSNTGYGVIWCISIQTLSGYFITSYCY